MIEDIIHLDAETPFDVHHPFTKIRWDFVGERKGFNQEQKQFTTKMRIMFRNKLLAIGAIRIVDSEWWLTDTSNIEAAKKACQWISEEYATHKIPICIGIAEYVTTQSGKELDKLFAVNNIVKQLESIHDAMEKAIAKKLIYYDLLRNRRTMLEHIERTVESVFKKHPRYGAIKDMIESCYDAISHAKTHIKYRRRSTP